MALLWIATYTTVFIGTIRYKYPLISPITQAIIAPFEFAVVIKFILSGQIGFDYVSLAYLYWTLIEIGIIAATIHLGYIPRKKISSYLLLVFLITAIMCYFVAYKDYMFFFSYFNTFLGEIFWFSFIRKREYPMRSLSLIAFWTKLIGDAIAIPVYFHTGIWLSSVMCVALPVLDLCFVLSWFFSRRRTKKSEMI